MNEVKLLVNKNTVELKLIDVQTVNYGFMGTQQQYEGVEPIGYND